MVQRLVVLANLGCRFVSCERASVTISSVLVLPVLLGIAGLAIEYGDALVTRAETQRVADLAVHSAVLAFGRGGDAAEVTLAAQAVTGLNGVAADETSVVIDSSGAGPVVRVTITTPRPLVLSRVLESGQSLNVTVRSAATLEQAQPACVQALDPDGDGIKMSGGTSITTAGCAVASNATVSASGSSRIVTETLTYDSDAPPDVSGGASIESPSGGDPRIARMTASDPMAGHVSVSRAQIDTARVAALQGFEMPAVVTGPNIHFDWNAATTQQQANAVGCTASLSDSTWNFDCPPGVAVNLGTLTIASGLSLNFALSGTSDTAYSFSGSIRNSGATMQFGPGAYSVAQGIYTEGGATTRFTTGTYRVGRGTSQCDNTARYSICNMNVTHFDGSGRFELEGGLYNDGDASLKLGTGSGNSFRMGPASNGDVMTLLGGSTTVLGDATDNDSVFEAVGNTITHGNSCFQVGAAVNHDFAGNVDLSGGVVLGSGLYTIDGYLHLGASGGGSSWCQGESISLRALGVTFNISGNGAMVHNNNCAGLSAFCAGTGYSGMQIVPPSSGPYENIAVLGPLSPNVTAGATFHAGASGGQIAGAFYFPHGPISLSGGASASGTSGDCLQMIGSSVSLSGGTSIASECVLSDSLGISIVRLVE